jgi:ribonucleoside-diphosphate reductase beta chain
MNTLMRDKEQGFLHLKNYFEDTAIKMAKETAELEMEWADYLLKEGNISGYNKEIAYHFIRYWTDYRLKEIHLKPIYNEKSSDIIDWFNSYRNLNNKQINLQEADNTNYQKGTLKNDLNKLDNFQISF